MAAILRLNFQRKGFQSLLDVLADTEEKLEAPLAGAAGARVESVMRAGIKKQFEQGGDPRWILSKPFGTRQPRRPTLGGAGGRVHRAWDRARAEKGPREVRIRQTDKIALAHHRGATIKPRQDPIKMRLALGRGVGVWLTDERLEIGLFLPARPVRFTDEMLLASRLAIFAGFQGTTRRDNPGQGNAPTGPRRRRPGR